MKARNILLIDDNDVDNYITSQMLLKNEIAENIVVKSSAIDALKFLHAIRNEPEMLPDYIFLDIRMPEMDGFDFLDQYSLFPDTVKEKCVIFMLTSSGDQKDVDRAAQYEYVKRFIRKPLNGTVLKEIW